MDILAPDFINSCHLIKKLSKRKIRNHQSRSSSASSSRVSTQTIGIISVRSSFLSVLFFHFFHFFRSNRFAFEVSEESWKRLKTLPNDECHFCRPHKFIQCVLGTITLRPTHPRNCPEATVSHFPTYSDRMGRLYAIWKGIHFST